ncbi:MAG: O-methyltransferase [Acidobacteria bacterium]|nr:O-methyltransferase [Acidobacteriota bacterium]
MPADKSWIDVDQYINDQVTAEDAALASAMQAAATAGLPPISVTAPQGKLLHLLARSINARRVLEIGTLAGYSTIWLARAVGEGGRVVTIEFDETHARIARTNFARAGLDARIDLRVGRAQDVLPRLEHERAGPFDFIFIDADKPSTTEYFEWSLELSRPGSLIFVDNVVRNGGLADGSSRDPDVLGMRRFLERLGKEPRVVATAIQTVGGKSYDGFALALVIG